MKLELSARRAALPPPVIAELYSSPRFGDMLSAELEGFRTVSLEPGYWQRAGLLRAEVRLRARKAPLADALIAQVCIDANIPLLTRDSDFRVFAEVGGLKLA